MFDREDFFTLMEGYVRACVAENGVLGVLRVRIQRYREFNILFGYAVGDRLVEAAEGLLRQVLRPDDRVVRVGEQDFAVLLPGIRNRNHGVLAANRIIRAFQDPMTVEQRSVLVTVAVGVAACPEHGTDPELLCRRADMALTDALRNSDRFAVYSEPEEQGEIPYGEFREAIVNNRLALYLQPIVDLRTHEIVGAEALSRWYSPTLGWVSPVQFIPYAEQTGLIVQITRWSLNTALRQCAEMHKAGNRVPFSVNLSARVFPERGVVEQILGAINIWDVPPQSLIVEVTETALMEDPLLSARVLERLRSAGVRIAIDDFGTGYSSFTYLKEFPASELKIDKSFVGDMLSDIKAAQLVRSMIDLAHNLELVVVAEGVENRATTERLIAMGCDWAQGYHLGLPVPAERFIGAFCQAGLKPVEKHEL